MKRLTTIAVLLLAALAVGSALWAAWEVPGRVVNRDGAGVSYCRVDFYVGNSDSPRYSVTTNADGVLYLTDPSYGDYRVKVSKYDREQWFNARVDQNGLNPREFVVYW